MKYYDSIAKGYDELYLNEQREKLEVISRFISKNKAIIQNPTKILDLGCGTGIGSDLSEKFSFTGYIGIDSSKKLITIANKKYSESKRSIFLVHQSEDITKLGFKKKEFSLVISISAVHHFSETKKIFTEIKRISEYFIVTVLTKIKKHDEIIAIIRRNFNVLRTDSSTKDTILLCKC